MFHPTLPAALVIAILTGSSAFAQEPASVQGKFVNNEGKEIGSVSVTGTAKGLVARIEVARGRVDTRLAWTSHAPGR